MKLILRINTLLTIPKTSTGIRKCDYKNKTFDNIPEGSIYRVKVEGTNDRILTYKNGIIYWY